MLKKITNPVLNYLNRRHLFLYAHTTSLKMMVKPSLFSILPFLTMKMQLLFPYALTRNPLEIHIAIEGLQGGIRNFI